MEEIEIESYCGLKCSECSYRETQGCRGCVASAGKPFHGGCKVAECAKSKNRRFCGECREFPCALLNDFAFDKAQGDNGARIEHCRQMKFHFVAEARRGLNPVSFCGHHCDYCFLGQFCGGCRSEYNCCSFATISEGGVCANVKCATEKGLEGCFECSELEGCEKGYYANEGEYIAKGSAVFISRYGQDTYTKALKAAIAAGESYPHSFDSCGSVENAVKLLEKYI